MRIDIKEIRSPSIKLDQAKVSDITSAFLSKVKNGNATAMDVINHILTIDEGGSGCIPQSMGIGWIAMNPHGFQKIVKDVNVFVEKCLRVYNNAKESDDAYHPALGLKRWFFQSFPAYQKLVELLSPQMCLHWVKEIYPCLGAINNSWISNFVRAGIPRQDIADAILKRLNSAKDPHDFIQHGHNDCSSQPWSALWSLGVTSEQMDKLRPQIKKEPSIAFETIEHLLASGIQPQEGDFHSFHGFYPWDVLTNTELTQALTICAQKSPNRTMGILDDTEVKRRLTLEQFDWIQMAAMRKVTSLQGLTLDLLERHFTMSGWETLAHQLVPVKDDHMVKMTAQFLFRVLCELPKNKREAFYLNVCVPVIGEVNPVRLYCAWRQLELRERDLEDTLLNKLNRDGYAIGFIREGTVPSGKRHGQRQWFVKYRGARYICDDDIHRQYCPKDGDEVVFNTGDRVRWLVPSRVGVTIMTPVMNDTER